MWLYNKSVKLQMAIVNKLMKKRTDWFFKRVPSVVWLTSYDDASTPYLRWMCCPPLKRITKLQVLEKLCTRISNNMCVGTSILFNLKEKIILQLKNEIGNYRQNVFHFSTVKTFYIHKIHIILNINIYTNPFLFLG